jgi:hypothetical protein
LLVAAAAASGGAPSTAKARRPLTLRPLCMAFCRTGRCRKRDAGACALRHDADKVAVCVRWLKGTCSCADGGACPLTHAVIPARMPVCSFFLEGRCGAEACPYLHVRVSPSAPVCTAFVAGFCPRGLACTLRHSLVCPALARPGGACANRARCRFHHPAPLQAARKRAAPPAPQEAAGAALADADAANGVSKKPRMSMLPAFARREPPAEP